VSETCENCKFFHITQAVDKAGWCLRNPPQVVVVHTKDRDDYWNYDYRSCWPEVDPNEWCGEWREK
jgi:hypothetical protein